MAKFSLLLFMLLMLTGCGVMKCSLLDDCRSHETEEADVLKVTADRLFPYKQNELDSGIILITRDNNFVDSECYDLLWVNGAKVARIGIRERIELKVPPGELVIKASTNDPSGPSRCSLWSEKTIIRDFTITKDQTKKFRIVHNLSPVDIDIQRAE